MKKLIVLLIAVALYLWDDILLGAPVALLAGVIGVFTAFIVSTVVYAVASYALTKLFVINNQRINSNNRLSKFINHELEGSHGRFSAYLLSLGKGMGIFLSSWLGGGILTTYLLKTGGYQGDIKKTAVVSNAIFAVMFCAQYSGLGWLLRELIVKLT